MELFVYALTAMLAGALATVQAGVNVTLRQYLGAAESAAFVSFLVGTLALGGWVVVLGRSFQLGPALAGAPWWAWLGGCLGAYFVVSTILLAPKLGAGTMMALFVAGQMLASLTLDHFGLLGFALRPISPLRALGAALLILGVILIRK